ncbi:hypothetical protein [Rhizorhabdus dicambivorans]|uniref:Uncharacterized protein n=1 Tax=Rhizorhabdus dicambivorans TaxID=1850238 RepID=A0A2A4FZ62_9SPHN|nr:hypothetical protein [Rhizorhabdus dicambivorans]ATE66761.1 hypothetical protein CMV14_22040 [Rhizorhabdus dicambivorans]PCE43752.1 hypothetical protein COO09_02105 [Rhizorhabdus dicambivorans]
MKTILAITAALLAAAPAAALTNDYSNQLKKLSSLQQRATMRRAVLDNGQYCKRIGPVAYQQSYKNLEMWTVQCDRGAAYAVFIGLDASVQVRPCRDLADLKLPVCRLPK